MTYSTPIQHLPSADVLQDKRLTPIVAALSKHAAAVSRLTAAEDARDDLVSGRAAALAREHTERLDYAAKVTSGAAKIPTPFRAPSDAEHAASVADAEAVIAAASREVDLARIEAEAVIAEHAAAIGEVASALLAEAITAARDAVAVAESRVAHVERLLGDAYVGALAQARDVARVRLGLAPGVSSRLLDSQASRFVAKNFRNDGARRLALQAESRGVRLMLGERIDVAEATEYRIADPRVAEPRVYGAQGHEGGDW